MSLVAIIAILGIIAILWWLYTELKLPQPFRIVAAVVIALIAIILLLQLTGGSGSLHFIHL